jgi:3-hydroxybutyryl-CoA dehydratase
MFDQGGTFFEDLTIGQSASFNRTVTESDILAYSELSGDTNPIHLDEDYAGRSMFKGRIAHGLLSAGFLSAVLGTKLPGPGAVYVAQTLRFKAPVRIGDHVVARVELVGLDGDRKRATFKTVCEVGDKVVIDGDAVLFVPSRN